MILADASVWIDYFNGVSNWQAERLDSEPVALGDLILHGGPAGVPQGH